MFATESHLTFVLELQTHPVCFFAYNVLDVPDVFLVEEFTRFHNF
jgi:hypothetical protein